MLVLDARGQKMLLGIFSESSNLLYQHVSQHSIPGIFDHIKSCISSFDDSFSPSKIAVTVAPGLHSSITQCINFSNVTRT